MKYFDKKTTEGKSVYDTPLWSPKTGVMYFTELDAKNILIEVAKLPARARRNNWHEYNGQDELNKSDGIIEPANTGDIEKGDGKSQKPGRKSKPSGE